MPVDWDEVQRAIDEEDTVNFEDCSGDEMEAIFELAINEESPLSLNVDAPDWETFHRLAPYVDNNTDPTKNLGITRTRTSLETALKDIIWDEIS